jgi:type I restriction-modification system DNA methylase subunit
LGELIDLISNTELKAENENSKDLFGRVYEYFLGEFANAEGLCLRGRSILQLPIYNKAH